MGLTSSGQGARAPMQSIVFRIKYDGSTQLMLKIIKASPVIDLVDLELIHDKLFGWETGR